MLDRRSWRRAGALHLLGDVEVLDVLVRIGGGAPCAAVALTGMQAMLRSHWLPIGCVRNRPDPLVRVDSERIVSGVRECAASGRTRDENRCDERKSKEGGSARQRWLLSWGGGTPTLSALCHVAAAYLHLRPRPAERPGLQSLTDIRLYVYYTDFTVF